MANLVYVTEFGGLGSSGTVPDTPKLAAYTVTISGVSTQSPAFTVNTSIVRVHADTICSVDIGGQNPTATATSQRMAIGATEYFFVRPGDKLAVISNT